jgi:RNA polymerase-binding transcription factor
MLSEELSMTDATTRSADLRQMLHERRREMDGDVQSRLRDGRATRAQEVRDQLDDSDANNQGDIDFALLQMRAKTVSRIDEALVRLDAGRYGACVECGRGIAARRLRALPFAVRCQPCEERHEAQGDAQQPRL